MFLRKKKLNLFIVDDEEFMISLLRHQLIKHFGNNLEIKTFTSGEACLEQLNENTHIVILDYFLNGKNGLEILQQIKDRSPKTEVIMFSNNENIVAAIESFKKGAKDFVIKDKNSYSKVEALIQRIITNPMKSAVKKYGFLRFSGLLLIALAGAGLLVYSILS
jgi:DNA-binding NtrC family response regulator